MARIGYARVSTGDQNTDSQLDDLKAAGCDRIFSDQGVSGKLARRPELDKALEYLRDGDDLVITRLSRLARNLRNLLDLADDLRKRNIGLVVLKQGIDTGTSTGRLMLNVLASIDEFQRELIVENTEEGLAAARARGRVGGRPARLSERQVKVVCQMYASRDHTIAEIADTFSVGASTIYRTLRANNLLQKASA